MRLPFAFLATVLGGGGGPAPPPTISSVTPDHGPESAATTITIDGSDFINGCTVTVNGFDCTDVVFVNSAQITCATPDYLFAGGPFDVTLTNPDLQSDTLVGAFTFTVVFDPGTFDLTSWQKPDFASLPFDGTASAGGSGGRRDASPGAADPIPGPALNGHVGMRYRRSNTGLGQSISKVTTTGGSAVLMESLVSNSDYTFSWFGDVMSAGTGVGANAYQRPQFLAADAHWGLGFSCDAALSGEQVITFNAAAGTITRAMGDWTTDGFQIGQTVAVRNTASNDGTIGAPIASLTATVLTFDVGHDIVDETTVATDDTCITSGGQVNVLHYTGGFSVVSRTCSPGLHWIYIRHTGGTTQIDIDGVAGSAQAHADHSGASGVQATTNYSNYVTRFLSMNQYERFTSQIAQSDTDRDNYKSYLNDTYGTSF